MQRPLRSLRRTPSTCVACGRLVDASDPTCGKCGAARPNAGWPAMSAIRPDDSPGIELGGPPPPRLAEPSDDEDEYPHTEEIPESVFDLARPTGVAVGVRRSGIQEPTKPPPDPEITGPITPVRIRVGPRAEADDRAAETLEAADYAAGSHENDEGRLYSGRYWIEETLSAGAAAMRYRAVQEPAVRRVVLTVLKAERAPEAQQALESRFLKDARLLARVRHPSLAPVHDAGRSQDGTCFATEEVLYGATFPALCGKGAMGPDALLAVLIDVTSALGAMHDAGVPHRLLRGDAIVVPAAGHRGQREPAQLGRFGWHVLPEDLAVDEDVDAVLAAAPEVLAGQEPDELSDVYAVGVLMYQALVGGPPYAGPAAAVRSAAVAGVPLVVPAGAGRAGELARIATRCLAPRPEDRFPSAHALQDALQALAKPVVTPLPPSPVQVQAPRPFPVAWAALALVGMAIPTLALVVVVSRPAPAPVIVQAPPALSSVASRPPAADAPQPVAAPVEPVVAPAAEAAAATPAIEPAAPPRVDPARPPAHVSAARPERLASPLRAAPVARSAPNPVTPPPAATPDPEQPETPVGAATAAAAPGPTQTTPVVVATVAAVPTPAPLPAAPSAPPVPGAAALTGLWLGKAPGATLALDLAVGADGKVSGRARRSDEAGEGSISGRVRQTDAGLEVSLQVTRGDAVETYSGLVVDGQLVGRVSSDGKSGGRFNAKR